VTTSSSTTPIVGGGAAANRSVSCKRTARVGAIFGLWDRAKLAAGHWGIFVDPEGHPWEVAHNPACTLNDDGTISL
jgi:hypothetical protein